MDKSLCGLFGTGWFDGVADGAMDCFRLSASWPFSKSLFCINAAAQARPSFPPERCIMLPDVVPLTTSVPALLEFLDEGLEMGTRSTRVSLMTIEPKSKVPLPVLRAGGGLSSSPAN